MTRHIPESADELETIPDWMLQRHEEIPMTERRRLTEAGRFWLLYLLLLVTGILGTVWAFVADAQTVPGSVELEWTLPTTGCSVGVTPCDNRPLTGAAALTAIEVYIAAAPIPDNSTMAPTLTLGPSVTTTTHTMQVANGATLYVRLKARNAGGVSPFNVQASKLVSVPVLPGVPSSVTITINIGPAP